MDSRSNVPLKTLTAYPVDDHCDPLLGTSIISGVETQQKSSQETFNPYSSTFLQTTILSGCKEKEKTLLIEIRLTYDLWKLMQIQNNIKILPFIK